MQDLVTVEARFLRDYGELQATATLAAGNLTGQVVVSFGTFNALGACDTAQGASATFLGGFNRAVWRVSGGIPPIARQAAQPSWTMSSVLYGSGSPLTGRPLNCANAVLHSAERPREALDVVPAFALPQVPDSPLPPREPFPGPGVSFAPPAVATPPPTVPPTLRLAAPGTQRVGAPLSATVTADRVGPATVTAAIGTGPHRVTQRRLLYIGSLAPKRFQVRFNHSQEQALRRNDKGRYRATLRVSAFGTSVSRTVAVR